MSTRRMFYGRSKFRPFPWMSGQTHHSPVKSLDFSTQLAKIPPPIHILHDPHPHKQGAKHLDSLHSLFDGILSSVYIDDIILFGLILLLMGETMDEILLIVLVYILISGKQ